ncbi:MAG: HAMP domain-containing sensor histidine kinase [Candidatus Omnitrophota bacterium]
MKEFFAAQIDYFYFLNGFAFLLLSWICFGLYSRKNTVMPWKWLGVFGFLNCLGIWSDIVILSLGSNLSFKLLHFCITVISFLILIEFGRRSIVVSNRTKDILIKRLFGSAGIVFLLSAVTGIAVLVTRNSIFRLPEVFFSYCLVAIFWAYQFFCKNIVTLSGRARRFRYFAVVILVFIAVLISSYFITSSIGTYYKNRFCKSLLTRAETIASILNPEQIKSLAGSSLDISNENYASLKKQLIAASRVNRDCRFIYLMGIRGKDVFFFADSVETSSRDYSPPGQIFKDASPKLVQSFFTGTPFIEGPLVDKWGEWVSSLSPIKDPATGKVIAILGMDVDAESWRHNIFEHRVAGILISFVLMIGFIVVLQLNESSFAKISASQTRFDAVAREMVDGIIICSHDYMIMGINPAAIKYLSIDETRNLNILEYILSNFSVTLTKESLTDSSQAHKNFDIIRQETECFKPLYLEARMDMLKSLSGEVSGIVLTLRDVTEKRMEEIMKQDFLGLVSHKLSTPTNVIRQISLMFQQGQMGELGEKQKKFIDTIVEKTFELEGLVSKLLNFVTVNSQNIVSSEEPINIAEYLPKLVNPMAEAVKEKKVELNIDCPDKSIILKMNRTYFNIVISNLIDNAIKFNDKDTIKINILVERAQGAILVSVADNGQGIPAEEQDKVFEKFYQIEKSFTGNVQGAGLGLALVKKIVGTYGGTINLKSEIAKGTQFTITFQQKI